MSQYTGKLSQSIPPLKGEIWLWCAKCRQDPNKFLSVHRNFNNCFICNNAYSYKIHRTEVPTAFDCEKCHQIIIKNDFKNWTSGNKKLNKVIRESQLNAVGFRGTFLEVFPFEFGALRKIGEGGYSSVYTGGGPRSRYRGEFKRNDMRNGFGNVVVLKSFSNKNSNIIENLTKELNANSKLYGGFAPECYGITQNPDDGQYMIVMQYVENGDLRRFLQDPDTLINWKYAIFLSRWIIGSLHKIHERNFMHKDFHTGNILIDSYRRPLIADLGLTSFIDEKSDEVIGVMPYIAPEVLCGKPYTQAADVYSFGMILWEFSSQQPPFGKLAHDHFLCIEICKNHRRPTIAKATPKCWIDLMRQCWDADPKKRPTAIQVFQKLDKWYQDYNNNILSEDIKQFLRCDEERYKFCSMTKEKIEEHYSTHPQAIYKSRSMSHYISLMQSCQIDRSEKSLTDTSLNSSKKRLHSSIRSEADGAQQVDDISLDSKCITQEIDVGTGLNSNCITQQIDVGI